MPRSRSPPRDSRYKDEYRSSSRSYRERDYRDSHYRDRDDRDRDYRDQYNSRHDYSRNQYRDRYKDHHSHSYDYDSKTTHWDLPPRHETDNYNRNQSQSSTVRDSPLPSAKPVQNSTESTQKQEASVTSSSKGSGSNTSAPATQTNDSAPTSSQPPSTTSSSQPMSAEEKRRQRMERLAKWKSQKAQEQKLKESIDSSNTSSSDHQTSTQTDVAEKNKTESNANANSTLPTALKSTAAVSSKVQKESIPSASPKVASTSSVSKMFNFADNNKPVKASGMNPLSLLTRKTNVSSRKAMGFGDDSVAKPKPFPFTFNKSGSEDGPGSDIKMSESPTDDTQENEGNKKEEEEEDPLDAFMSTINVQKEQSEKDVGQLDSLPSLVMNEDEPKNAESSTALEDDENFINPETFMAELEKKKRKDIPVVDHSKVNYEPFRKNFYFQPPELANLPSEDVDMMRLELDGIKVRGANCPAPVLKWSQFGFPVPVMEVVNKLGFEKPTSIQSQALPAIMSGRDVIGVAKTGSGKTMAFLLPLFRHIKDQRPLGKMEGPIALVMTPTRELAVQIFRECTPFLKALDLRAVCAYGGSPIQSQIADLKRGAEIVVCTPGRMIDLLAANSGRVTNLQRVSFLVLDEADRMFDMGFEPQIMKIINNIRPDRQTVLFSATFPRQMENLARKTLKKAIEIIVGARSVVAPEITQIVEVRSKESKFARLLELLGDFYNASSEDARAIIFVDRQEATDNLWKSLMNRGYVSLSIHGGKEQIDRDSALADFRKGVVNLLIATSVAARGLDVKQLNLVINYDAPNHMEDYVHRVGRTGRAGNQGTAVTFITPDQDRAAANLAKALKLSNVEVPADVQKLADEFLEKVKVGKAKFGSGFHGKGLEKLDEARDSARILERKAYGEDDTNGNNDDKDNENDEDIPALPSTKTSTTAGDNSKVDKYNFGPAVVSKGHHESTEDKSKRQQILRAGAAPDNHGPDTSAYHSTLEINDYPQQARWAVTNNMNITKIIQANSTSITTKGRFYPTGQKPGEGEEPKLYILIEGQSESSVANAYKDLVNLLKTGIGQAMNADNRGGRYTV